MVADAGRVQRLVRVDGSAAVTKWRFTAVSIDGGVIMTGVFQCRESDALGAAAAFVQKYNGWQLKTISMVELRARK